MSKLRAGTHRIRSTQKPLSLMKIVRRLRSAGIRRQFGRGGVVPRAAAGRRVIVKARVVRNRASAKVLAAHLRYLAREGSEEKGDQPSFYDSDGPVDEPARKAFKRVGGESRHHFRLIISPENANGLELSQFTQSVMRQVEEDVGTALSWVATNHYDTDHPHAHVVIHGVDERGQDLVLRRDYLSNGIRQRASAIAGLLIAPDLSIRRAPNADRDLGRSLG